MNELTTKVRQIAVMSTASRLRDILLHARRGAGNTTALAAAAKQSGGILICGSEEEAGIYKRKFNIKTGTAQSHYEGYGVPLIVDNHLVRHALCDVSELQEAARSLCDVVDGQDCVIENARIVLARRDARIAELEGKLNQIARLLSSETESVG